MAADIITLGDTTVRRIGLGTNRLTPSAENLEFIRAAVDAGLTHIDTAFLYTSGESEQAIGSALDLPRAGCVVATKGGYRAGEGAASVLRGQIEESLRRLQTDVIDLYYLHRVNPEVPLEDSVGALADLVTEGKVRYIGLSEVTGDQLRAAHAIHPVAAVQSEYSLWTRDPEVNVTEAARELGAGLVAYSPLGRGFLTGTVNTTALAANDGRRRLARFSADAAAANQAIADTVRKIAEAKGATAGQVAIAWTAAQTARLGIPVVPIPGTKRVKWIEENAAALDVQLTDSDLAALEPLAAHVTGARY
jgi:aryl-alcohol dehydrogenase-like predicted oxidoreductase